VAQSESYSLAYQQRTDEHGAEWLDPSAFPLPVDAFVRRASDRFDLIYTIWQRAKPAVTR
jgi:hypothetical protein